MKEFAEADYEKIDYEKYIKNCSITEVKENWRRGKRKDLIIIKHGWKKKAEEDTDNTRIPKKIIAMTQKLKKTQKIPKENEEKKERWEWNKESIIYWI
jgi:hypothetical protein